MAEHTTLIPHITSMDTAQTESVLNLTIPILSDCNTTYENGTGCTNGTSGQDTYGRNENLAKVEIILQAVILLFAICGNTIVVLVLLGTHRRKKRLSRMNMMIIHLSLADLFVAFFNVLPQLAWDITYRFIGNDFLCRFVKYFQVVAMYSSSYILVSTAIDRFLAICYPFSSQTWTKSKNHTLVAVAWILSLLFSIPQLFIFGYREVAPGAGVFDCWAEFDNPDWSIPLYITWVTVAIYIVPFLLLAGAYGRICYVVFASMLAKEPSMKEKKVNTFSWRAKVQVSQNGTSTQSNGDTSVQTRSNPRAHVRGLSNAKVKTVKLTLVVITCYLICWGPFFISQMWSAWDPNAPFTGAAFTIMMLMASLNSCTNPWIYLAFSDNLYRQVALCFTRGRFLDRSSTAYFSESHMRSTMRSNTEVTRVDQPIQLTEKT